MVLPHRIVRRIEMQCEVVNRGTGQFVINMLDAHDCGFIKCRSRLFNCVFNRVLCADRAAKWTSPRTSHMSATGVLSGRLGEPVDHGHAGEGETAHLCQLVWCLLQRDCLRDKLLGHDGPRLDQLQERGVVGGRQAVAAE